MSEGILELSISVAPELVHERHGDFCSGRNGAIEQGIRILCIYMKHNGCTASRTRSESTKIGKFVIQHDDRISDFNLGMHDRPARAIMDSTDFSTESFFIKFNRFFGAFND